MPTKIFVGNLSSDTTGEDLRPYFEQYGEVTECDVLRNFGFVHMAVEKEAEQAINELTGTLIHGQRINVEKSTGRGGGSGGRGGGGGKMSSSRGGPRGGRGGLRGALRGRGLPGIRGEHDPYDPYPPPPRSHPYSRDPYPYDYYDRHYPPDRLPPPPRHPDDRRLPYDRDDRLPPPRDPYDRYLPPRYPSRADPYAYDRYPPPRAAAADPYERPPPDYYSRYRTYDGYEDPPRRPGESAVPPAPGGTPGGRAANGYEERRLDPQPASGTESFSSTYTSYYDRFYSKAGGANGAAAPRPALPQPAGRPGMPARGTPNVGARNDQQAALQTGPIYF